MLESLIGSIYGQNLQLPLAYGAMYRDAYNPLYQYYGNQAGNMTSIGNQSMGLYGTLAAQDMEAQRYNSLAPVLAGLLGQFSGFGGGGFNISPIRSGMGGYQGVVNNAYSQAQAYDDNMASAHGDMLGRLPTAPYAAGGGMSWSIPASSPQPPQAAPQSPPTPTPTHQFDSAGTSGQQRSRRPGRLSAQLPKGWRHGDPITSVYQNGQLVSGTRYSK